MKLPQAFLISDRLLVKVCFKTLQPSTAMSLTLVLPNHSVGT